MHSPHIRFLNSITVTVTDIPVLIFKTGDHITLTFHDHIRNIVSVPDRITDDIFQLIIHNDIKILLDHLKRISLILLCILPDKIKNLLFHTSKSAFL